MFRNRVEIYSCSGLEFCICFVIFWMFYLRQLSALLCRLFRGRGCGEDHPTGPGRGTTLGTPVNISHPPHFWDDYPPDHPTSPLLLSSASHRPWKLQSAGRRPLRAPSRSTPSQVSTRLMITQV